MLLVGRKEKTSLYNVHLCKYTFMVHVQLIVDIPTTALTVEVMVSVKKVVKPYITINKYSRFFNTQYKMNEKGRHSRNENLEYSVNN